MPIVMVALAHAVNQALFSISASLHLRSSLAQDQEGRLTWAAAFVLFVLFGYLLGWAWRRMWGPIRLLLPALLVTLAPVACVVVPLWLNLDDAPMFYVDAFGALGCFVFGASAPIPRSWPSHAGRYLVLAWGLAVSFVGLYIILYLE